MKEERDKDFAYEFRNSLNQELSDLTVSELLITETLKKAEKQKKSHKIYMGYKITAAAACLAVVCVLFKTVGMQSRSSDKMPNGMDTQDINSLKESSCSPEEESEAKLEMAPQTTGSGTITFTAGSEAADTLEKLMEKEVEDCEGKEENSFDFRAEVKDGDLVVKSYEISKENGILCIAEYGKEKRFYKINDSDALISEIKAIER